MTGGFTIEYIPSELAFSISVISPYVFRIFTDDEILSGAARNFEYDISLDNANQIIGNYRAQDARKLKPT